MSYVMKCGDGYKTVLYTDKYKKFKGTFYGFIRASIASSYYRKYKIYHKKNILNMNNLEYRQRNKALYGNTTILENEVVSHLGFKLLNEFTRADGFLAENEAEHNILCNNQFIFSNMEYTGYAIQVKTTSRVYNNIKDMYCFGHCKGYSNMLVILWINLSSVKFGILVDGSKLNEYLSSHLSDGLIISMNTVHTKNYYIRTFTAQDNIREIIIHGGNKTTMGKCMFDFENNKSNNELIRLFAVYCYYLKSSISYKFPDSHGDVVDVLKICKRTGVSKKIQMKTANYSLCQNGFVVQTTRSAGRRSGQPRMRQPYSEGDFDILCVTYIDAELKCVHIWELEILELKKHGKFILKDSAHTGLHGAHVFLPSFVPIFNNKKAWYFTQTKPFYTGNISFNDIIENGNKLEIPTETINNVLCI
ncbi:hypothetical protein EPVG_00252 [Emiliania huxleyi virus 201]|nr:hypothetical protein EPVG_00252 [Emiliania huxleyi virus 201]